MHKLERYHVPADRSYVGKSTPMILKASLGTCVGVALFDPKNGIGGLIQLLLGKSPLHADGFQLEKYATTGLPLFFKALLDLGAELKNLVAWVAGGALVGLVTECDLEFDIGGRTTERVVEFLAR